MAIYKEPRQKTTGPSRMLLYLLIGVVSFGVYQQYKYVLFVVSSSSSSTPVSMGEDHPGLSLMRRVGDGISSNQNTVSASVTTTAAKISAPFSNSSLWTSSPAQKSKIPSWMEDYFEWHGYQMRQRRQIFVSNNGDNPDGGKNELVSSWWESQRLLVLRCMGEDRCGGTADRLKSLPFFLAVARKTQRLLFLRWDRPFALEEFIIPAPYSKMNWTVPVDLEPLLTNHDPKLSTAYFGGNQLQRALVTTSNPSVWLVEVAAQMSGGNLLSKVVREIKLQSGSAGEQGVEAFVEPTVYFHDMFLILFAPAPAIQTIVQQHMKLLHLTPNQFVVMHYRAKYPGEPYRETQNLTILKDTVIHGIHCALSQTSRKGDQPLPVYVASDTVATLQAAQVYATQSGLNIVSHLDIPSRMIDNNDASSVTTTMLLPEQDPPHLNFAKEEDPSAFYSIFIDLFIMSQSRCVSFGPGGFGRFGSLVSFNASCRTFHSAQGTLRDCSNPA